MPPAGADANSSAQSLIEGILQRGEAAAAPAGDPSELLTFLFADIRGYTRFTQQYGDEAAAKLTAKFAMIVRDLVSQYSGTVFELRGDEALCVFTSPRQSLRLAIALQQRFVEETADDAALPMTVGIGIDAGEAIRGADGYRGGALNLAARLCAQAKAGQVLATAEVTHLARTISGIRYVTLDSLTLKGLSEPVRPVGVVPEGEDPARQLAALLAAASPPPNARRVRWLPGPLATRPTTALAAAAVVTALVAGSLVFAVERTSGGAAPLAALAENSVGVIDPANGHILAQVGVDTGPAALAAEFGSVWTANTDASTVSRIDTSSRHVSRTIAVGAAPAAIATGLGAVWVANGGDGTVSRIDPITNTARTIPVGAAPAGVVVAAGSVWVTNTAAGTVSRIDPGQNQTVETIPVSDGPSGIAAGHDLWVANSTSNTVSRINLRGSTHAVSGPPIHVGNDPKGLAVVGDNVWVTNNLDGNVVGFAGTGASLTGATTVGPQPTHVASLGGHLWIATQGAQAIAEIDPAASRRVRLVRLGVVPGGVVAAAGKIWVSTTVDPGRHRGGTVRVIGEDPGSIDPDYLNSVPGYELLNGVYDGLVGFRPSPGADGTALVPDLATRVPEPTNGGLTYTFQLRRAIRWSTGRPVTVFDVQRGIERAVVADFAALKHEILGAGRCGQRGCVVPGIAVDPANRTVTIKLVRPDSNFLENLTAGLAVPADTPLAEQNTVPSPSTGPYRVSTYVRGKLIVLTRNRFFRQWSAAAQPAGFPDALEWRIDPSTDGRTRTAHAVAAVAGGHTDWADARAAAPVGVLQARFGDRVRVLPTLTMHGLSLNTRMPPFNDPRVRRALAYAIDRDAVANDWFTPAVVTCQVLPPDSPGYHPYCPYTLRPDPTGTWKSPDVTAGLDLVRGLHPGAVPVTVWAPPNAAAGIRHVVSALSALGYDARLAVYTKKGGDYFGFVQDSRNNVQAAFFGWVAGGVSAEGGLAIFKCAAFSPGSPTNVNTSQFCNPSIDHLMGQAVQDQAESLATANDVWAQVDRRLVDAAPYIPLVTPRWVDLLSTRMHNYRRSPLIGVLFDQMWVR
jgi:peptide/nickel transport system substrate-binding protein